MVNKENIQKWVDALRSGDYKQLEGQLVASLENVPVKHCCLGVACDLYHKETGNGRFLDDTFWDEGDNDYNIESEGELTYTVARWLGIPDEKTDPEILVPSDEGFEFEEVSATHANDKLLLNFNQIADAIERRYLKDGARREN